MTLSDDACDDYRRGDLLTRYVRMSVRSQFYWPGDVGERVLEPHLDLPPGNRYGSWD